MRPTHCARSIAALVLIGLLSIPVVSFARQPDAWITAKVKTKLILSPVVGGTRIDVDTEDGHVTLHGNVSTKAERDEAKRIASAVEGVRSVRDLVQVVPTSRRKETKLADDRIKEDVQKALEAQSRLAKSSISVRSVNQGVVLLHGKADTMSDHLLAIAVADRVAGTRRVASEVESPDTFGDREVWFDDGDTDKRNSSAGDAWITAKTKFRLISHPDISASDINVDTYDGTVTLFGTVPSDLIKRESARVTREVSGVREVRDLLIIVPPKDKRELTVADDQIAAAVDQRLKSAGFEDAIIEVEVKAGVARLTGTVKRPIDRYDAVVIANATDGVRAVRDDLRLVSKPS